MVKTNKSIKQWFEERWAIKGWWQITMIFIVFALTGSSSVFVGKKLMLILGFTEQTNVWIRIPVRIVLVFIIYQVLLLWIGFLFGQFPFFWKMEKKIFGRIAALFKTRDKAPNRTSSND